MTLEEELGKYLSSRLTDVAGSSSYIKENFVTYANEAKHKILGVSWDILNNFGAVSEECAEAMANGLYEATDCDIALCTTGIAGPTGGTKEKPVGLVYISMRYKGIVTVKEVKLSPTLPRIEMKEQFANQALKLALDILTRDRI